MATCLGPAVSPTQLTTINVNFPASLGSNQIGRRALECVKRYFLNIDPNALFTDLGQPGSGFINVQYIPTPNAQQQTTLPLLVKGTKRSCWKDDIITMRVTGSSAYDAVAGNPPVPVYRVVDVNGTPIIWELKYNIDFNLVADNRWRAEPI